MMSISNEANIFIIGKLKRSIPVINQRPSEHNRFFSLQIWAFTEIGCKRSIRTDYLSRSKANVVQSRQTWYLQIMLHMRCVLRCSILRRTIERLQHNTKGMRPLHSTSIGPSLRKNYFKIYIIQQFWLVGESCWMCFYLLLVVHGQLGGSTNIHKACIYHLLSTRWT